MAYYRNISTTFWTDRKVDDEFTPEDKYFYLYLITNPHTNICGCYEIGMKQMSRETGYNEETVKRLLHRMQYEHNVIRYDTKTKEVFILNWSKYNWSKSEKLTKAVLNVAETIKSPIFKKNLIDLINNNININNLIQNTDNRYSKQIQITETDTDTDTVVCIPYTYPMDTVSETDKKDDISGKSKKTPSELEKILTEYTDNAETQQAIRDFIKMRKALKSPMTDRALKLLLNRLDELSPKDEQKRIAILNQSIERGWKSVFPLKDNAEEQPAADIEEYKAVINDFLF